MRNALRTLESKFELHLDQYCLAMERGDIDEAEMASDTADDLLEAIGVLKLVSDVDSVDRRVRKVERAAA